MRSRKSSLTRSVHASLLRVARLWSRTSPGCLAWMAAASRAIGGFLRRAAMCRARRVLASLAIPALRLHASAQRIHEINDFRRCALSWHFDLLAGLLFL